MARLRLWQRRNSCRSRTTTACFLCIPSKISKMPGNGTAPCYFMGSDAERKLLELYFQTFKSFLLGWLTLSGTVTSACCMSRKVVLDLSNSISLSFKDTCKQCGGGDHLVVTPALLSSCAPIYLLRECVWCLSGWLGTSMAFELRFPMCA